MYSETRLDSRTTPRVASRLWNWLCQAWLVHVSTVLALVFALYGRVTTQPLYWDDARQYFFATENSLLKIWLNQTGYAYYRPALFTLYRAAFTYLTPSFTAVCYAAGLIIHAANCILVGYLAAELTRWTQARAGRRHVSTTFARWLASLLLLAYPFTTYVVANFAALQHLVVMLAALLGALAASAYVRTRQRRWLAVMLAVSILAPFFHEAGVVIGPLLLSEIAILDRRAVWQCKRSLTWLLFLPLCYAGLWLMVPKGRSDALGVVDVTALVENLTFFMQGLTYPLQPLAGALVHGLHWRDVAAVWAIALPSLGLAAYVLWRSGQSKALTFSLVWFVLAGLPSIALLPAWYVIPAPRLLYIVAPAPVLICTLACLALADLAPAWAAKAVGVALTVVLLAFPVFFILGKLALFQVALSPLKQLASLAQRYPGQRHLVLNSPNWVANVEDPYALGSWGVSVAPDYVLLNELVLINSGVQSRFDGAYFPALAESLPDHTWGPYHENDGWDPARLAANVAKYDHVWVINYAQAPIQVEEAGSARSGPALPPSVFLASFEKHVFLASGDTRLTGQTLTLTLNWLDFSAERDLTVFRHVLDCHGDQLGQADGYALGRALPFGLLAPGAELRDVRAIALKSLPADGCYIVQVGLFRPDGSRLGAVTPQGVAFDNGAVAINAPSGSQ
jgi:hypothetical protein